MRIFISYRRADLGGHAHLLVGRLADSLGQQLGDDNVFYDIESIPPGRVFEEHIESRIAEANAVLVVIGPDWISEIQRRANDKVDFVRMEVSEVLSRDIHLIPVPIDEVKMPDKDELPDSISALATYQEFRIRTQKDFKTHVENLVELLDRLPAKEAIVHGSLRATKESNDSGNTLKFSIRENGNELSYGTVLDRWIEDQQFRAFFESLIVGTQFEGYFWETPPITRDTQNRPFEFAVIKRPTSYMEPDRKRYAKYFDSDGTDSIKCGAQSI